MSGAAFERWLLRRWFQPDGRVLPLLTRPLAALYGRLQASSRVRQEQSAAAQAIDRPVVVVGNLIVGGAGKTPVTLATLDALRQLGWHPGVVSRGYGGRASGVHVLDDRSTADQVGDEPWLIRHRSGVPVAVGRDRLAAARALLQAHPAVDLIVADDGLQHRRLARQLEIVVFDDRGIGNGRLLPAGPLREPFGPHAPSGALVVYTAAHPSTPWPGLSLPRALRSACRLNDWLSTPQADHDRLLSSLAGPRVLAMAGIAVPDRFFDALTAAGLTIDRLPLPDHADLGGAPPWPPGTTCVVTTEKDAGKLARWAGLDRAAAPAIWVARLDLDVPAAFAAELQARLPGRP